MKRDNRLCVWWVNDDGPSECGQPATHLVSQPGRARMPVCHEHVAWYLDNAKFTVEPIDAQPNDHSAESGAAA